MWTDTAIEAAGRAYDPADVDVLPPVAPSKVLAVGRNYHSYHDSPEDIPEEPFIWLKGGPNVVAGHGDTITIPSTGEVVYEAELGVVIGEQCRHVGAADALSVVDGFTCVNDITNHTDRDAYGVRFKSFDNAAVVGPAIAPVEAVPSDARIQLRLNGETKQDASREGLRFGVPAVIEEITAYLTLEPGDIVPMGTPGNVGALHDGDRVEIEIDGIGTLRHGVEGPA